MKILLIAPPWLDIYGNYGDAAKLGVIAWPLGLLYVAGSIEQAGHEVRVVDMESENVDANRLLDLIRDFQPDLFGLTATTPIFKNAANLAGVLKTHYPDTPIMIGGVHSTIVGREVLDDCDDIDFQIRGEAEGTIQEVIERLDKGESLHGVAGVVYRDGDKIMENPGRASIEDLDSIPMAARHLLNPENYQHSLPNLGFIRYACIYTSRGCPFKCTFCSQHTMHGRRMRWHSVERIIEELRYVIEVQKIKHVVIVDDTMTLNRKRMMKLCAAIRESGLKFTFEGWTHTRTVDEELLIEMKSVGLIRLSFGIESGDPEILAKIEKGTTLEYIREAYRIAAKVGIETRGSAIIGNPYETRETVWRTIKFIRSLKECQQIFLNVACPYPGTALYEFAKNGQAGMRMLTNDYSAYKRYGDPVIEVNDLTSKDLKRLQTIGLLLFYMTPRRIWHNVYKRAGLRVGLVNSLAFAKGIISSLIVPSRATPPKAPETTTAIS